MRRVRDVIGMKAAWQPRREITRRNRRQSVDDSLLIDRRSRMTVASANRSASLPGCRPRLIRLPSTAGYAH